MTSVPDGTFDVLFVCTGNVCRSPMAERLMRAGTDSPVLHTSSAGTHAMVGYGMDLPSAQVLRALGGDPDGHVARRLTKQMVTHAGLVLTASAEQRSLVLRQAPAAMRRVFTLREFARLAAGVPADDPGPAVPSAEQLAQRVAQIAAQRGGGGVAPGDDDIADPFGAPMPEVQRVGGLIADAVSSALAALGLPA